MNANIYECKIHHKPAFLMQVLAAVMANEMPNVNFALIDVAKYLESTKLAIGLAYVGGIKHAHYTESYYLLATKLD